MIEKVREAESAMGREEKIVQPVEEGLRAFARRSIFALCDIEKGEEFTMDNIAVLRCGKLQPGLAPKEYTKVVGRRAARLVRSESAIRAGDIA